MLMMDRITHISEQGGKYGKGEIVAELDIRPDLWFLDCHFESDPVMPGCLGLDATWQLLGFFLGWVGNPGRGRALGVGNVKFSGQVLPTAKKLTYRIDLKRVISRKLVLGLAAEGAARDAAEAKFPTATLAQLTWEGDWTSPGRGGATLVRFTRPRYLDPSLGPDED